MLGRHGQSGVVGTRSSHAFAPRAAVTRNEPEGRAEELKPSTVIMQPGLGRAVEMSAAAIFAGAIVSGFIERVISRQWGLPPP